MSQHLADTLTSPGPYESYALTALSPTDDEWDAFVDGHARAHLLQTSAWAALKQRFGWSAFRIALGTQDRRIVAGASVLLRSAFGLRIAYIPRGPLTDWSDSYLTTTLLEEIELACRQRGAALLKMEPGLPDSMQNRTLLERHGFVSSAQTVQPRSTIVLDIAGDENAILKRMKSKWRYNIRLSGRKDVTVRTAGEQDLDVFNELMATTGERDGFGVHSAAYYRAAFDLFVPERAAYLLAEYQEEPLGAIVVAATGDTACYLWGASSNRERNRMPNHALQWTGIRWAKARGATRYDLWGIPDDVGKIALGLGFGDDGVDAEALPVDVGAMPPEDLWGVFRFKQGFGGSALRDVGAWDKGLNTLGYRLYETGLALHARGRDLPSWVRNPSHKGLSHGRAEELVEPAADAETWGRELAALPEPHVLQSWEWGEIKAQTGWHADRVLVANDGGTHLAAFQFLWRELAPHLPVRIAYVPKGPVLDWHNGDVVDRTLDVIQAHARERNCVFVKIDPDVRSDLAEGLVVTEKLKRRGWRYSNEQIQFRNTATSDLRLDEDELLARMKSKWRYNIRLARRRGISVRRGTSEDLPAFYAMYAETGTRDGFLIRPYSYYAYAWETMLLAQRQAENPAGGALLLAEHEEETEPVAGLFLFKYGQRTWYFYGASTDKRRRDMPNYLLQWEAMVWAREQGCRVYDWWGAPTDLDDSHDSMQGVWQFKKGFGAEFQPHIGAWDYATNPALYALYSEAIPRVLDLMRRWKSRGQEDDLARV